ncbi:Pecanex-like protein 4, partial [Orchesella cincta]
LHVWITLELVTEHLESSLKKSLDLVVHSLQQLLPCILTIRFYALAVTEPHNSTINIIVAYLYRFVVFRSEDSPMKFVILLFIVSICHTVLKRFLQYFRMVVIFTHSTFSSSLLDKKYVAVATLISAPVSISSLLITSVVKGMTLVPLFTLPVFTIGFPRPRSFWKGIWFNKSCGQNETQKIMPIASSVDWTIYADAAPFLVLAFAKRSEESKS